MKPIITLVFSLLSVSFALTAQVSSSPELFSPLAGGYLERARVMSDAGNYEGVIDQLRHLDTQRARMSAAEAEEYTYLLANAYYQRDDADCLQLLYDFCRTFPASPLAPKAALAIGDFHFFRHQWADALAAYNDCDMQRLNREDMTLYDYRRALCLIKTGHFEEAREAIYAFEEAPGYENAFNFYSGYLDYIDGDFKSAYQRFSMVPDGIKGLDAGYYMAQIEYSRGEYDRVISRGSALLRRNPDPELAPEISRIVGLSYFKQGELGRARDYLSDYFATTTAEPEPDAVYAMGAIDYAEGRYNAARQRFSQLTDLNNAVGQGAWLYLGQCSLQQDNASAAALAFEKAWKLDFDKDVTETALYNYVTTLTRGAKIPFSSSSELLEKFVSTYPDSQYTPEVEAYLATAYYNDRNYAKALRYIESIRNPSAAVLGAKQKILYETGIENMTNGKTDQAVTYLKQCVALKQYDRALAAQASLWLGDAYFSLGRFKEAAASYEYFVSNESGRENRALGYYDLGYAQYKLEEYAKAAASFNSALGSRPALDARMANDARIRRADCLYYTGKYSDASALYTQAINSGATDSDYALYRRAVINGLTGNTSAKIADLKQIETDYPHSRWLADAYREQALAYEEAGRSAEAADAYKKRLGVTGITDLDELLSMATAMNRASRWEDLLDVVDRIRHAGGLEPDEMQEIDLYEADALTALGRASESMPIYSRLAENPSSAPGSKSAVILSELEIKQGDFEAAKVRMEEFTDIGSPHQYWLARGFIALADAYYGLGEKSLAREYVTSLSENYPGGEADIKKMISTRLSSWK